MSNTPMNYGRYQIESELGKGSMGVVFKAHDPQIDRIVALKVLHPDKMTNEDFVQRFLKEAKAIGRLSHPNIVTVFDVGRDHDTIYIAMEFLDGSPLNELIAAHSLDLDTSVDLGIQVAEALNYAHKKGIIHRDIKPTNIIITPSGQVKITDFGIARIEDPLDHQQTQIGEILGTPAYMSPEQVKGQPVDNRADLFSLGIILYELCTGKRPFAGDSIVSIFRAIMDEPPAQPESINSALPTELSAVILKSLEKTPNMRFQSGKEMAASLRQCISATKSSPSPAKVQHGNKNIAIWVSASVASLLILALLLYFKSADQQGQDISLTIDHPPPPPLQANEPVALVDEPVTLNVETDPPGAQIYLNNSFSGKTPAVLKLPMGKYEVRLTLADYYDWEAQLHLDKEGETPLFVELLSTSQ